MLKNNEKRVTVQPIVCTETSTLVEIHVGHARALIET